MNKFNKSLLDLRIRVDMVSKPGEIGQTRGISEWGLPDSFGNRPSRF